MGATLRKGPHNVRHSCFNPRARDGRDIHWHENLAYERGFNPRARDGRD